MKNDGRTSRCPWHPEPSNIPRNLATGKSKLFARDKAESNRLKRIWNRWNMKSFWRKNFTSSCKRRIRDFSRQQRATVLDPIIVFSQILGSL